MSDPLELKLISRSTVLEDLIAVHEMGLRPDVFEDPINQAAFSYAINFWRSSQMKFAPTLDVFREQFGPGLADKLPIVHLVEEPAWYIAQTLMDRYSKNTVEQIMLDVAKNVSVDPQASLMEMASRALDAANQVAPRNTRSDMTDFATRRERYVDRYQSQDPGMTLGFPEIDDHTGGIRPGELCAVAGFTKVGKSWVLFNAAVEARRQGFTPLVMALEMSVQKAEDRIDELYSGVSSERLEAGKLKLDEMTVLTKAQEELASLGPLFVERPQRGERTVPYMCSRARQLGADYLIIDQLSWIDSVKSFKGDNAQRQETSDTIFSLREEISRESVGKLPCLLAVQHNRSSVSSTRGGGARGQLHTFAHSSMIEQTVDLALGLYQSDEQRIMNRMGIDIMGARRCNKAEYLLEWHLSDLTRLAYADRIDGALTPS